MLSFPPYIIKVLLLLEPNAVVPMSASLSIIFSILKITEVPTCPEEISIFPLDLKYSKLTQSLPSSPFILSFPLEI